jgi:hypothetical protein
MLTETLLRIPFTHWLQEKCTRVSLSQAASGMILQNHKQLPVSIFSFKIIALESLKWVTGGIFKNNYLLISKEQAKTLSLSFSSTTKQIIVKTISTCTENAFLLLQTFKK